MRTPIMEHRASNSRTRAGSNASLQARSDFHHDPSSQPQSDREGRSSRASSRTQSDNDSYTNGGYRKARKPINEAVTSAFTQATDMNHQSISPEILSQITSQITANVLQHLKVAQNTAPIAVPSTMTAEPVDSSSSFAGSPPIDRKVYTPPSPHRASDLPTLSPTFSNFSQGSRQQPTSPKEKRAPSPVGSGSQNEDSDEKEKLNRPAAPKRISTSGDATILEKVWGKMYDSEGQYTQRLGQFLRGIAVHIIEDYEPRHSLVITPEKMLKYYEETKLPNECYPWHVIFDDRTSSISRMFREVEVQHHLVQERVSDRPDIPGVTPQGFETWMKLVLKARPDLEYERLAKTALNMPISNPDDKKERFPKEISRRLFPKESDSAVAAKLEKVLRTHCGVRIPTRNNSVTETDPRAPSTTANKTSGIPQTTSLPQRSQTIDPSMMNASGYGGRSSAPDTSWHNLNQSSSNNNSQDEGINTKPIERERKPYVAQPGIGKNHDGSDGAPLSKASTASDGYTATCPPIAKVERSSSVTGRSRADSISRGIPPVSIHQKSAQPVDIPEPTRQRTKSIVQEPRSNRNRSPSESGAREYGHRSEGDIKPSSNQSTSSTDHQSASYRPERHNQDRYEPRGSFSGDPRDRGREQKTRFQSTSGVDPSRHYYSHDDDHYRPAPAYASSDGGYSQYPPNAYRAKGS